MMMVRPFPVLILLCFYFSTVQMNGICNVLITTTRRRHVFDRATNKWLQEVYQVPEERKDCCEGFRKTSASPLMCTPVCEPECQNADCIEPNMCVCHAGKQPVNNSTTSCYDVCESCVNGACNDNESECTCFDGYKQDETSLHICNPVCDPPCVNSTCTAPNTCECFDRFVKDHLNNHTCKPECKESCVFGDCTDPDVCTCNEGYINDQSAPSICIPFCNQTCEEGACTAPDTCTCHEGLHLHPRNKFWCVPKGVSNSTLNHCELNMHKGVKFDNDSGCFQVKDRMKISGNAQCQVLKDLSRPVCSQAGGENGCALMFTCSTRRNNGVEEIYCDYDTDKLVTSLTGSVGINSTNWEDIVLIVNSHGPSSPVDQSVNQTKDWLLIPSTTNPVCGKTQFKVEIRPFLVSTLDSSFLTWLKVSLICAFVLMVLSGVGGFLWARHRKLNDPLNYRENMMRECYSNECYEGHPSELMPDDESDLGSSVADFPQFEEFRSK